MPPSRVVMHVCLRRPTARRRRSRAAAPNQTHRRPASMSGGHVVTIPHRRVEVASSRASQSRSCPRVEAASPPSYANKSRSCWRRPTPMRRGHAAAVPCRRVEVVPASRDRVSSSRVDDSRPPPPSPGPAARGDAAPAQVATPLLAGAPVVVLTPSL
jgi:hypothetical protein